jgi:hypothetical protein
MAWFRRRPHEPLVPFAPVVRADMESAREAQADAGRRELSATATAVIKAIARQLDALRRGRPIASVMLNGGYFERRVVIGAARDAIDVRANTRAVLDEVAQYLRLHHYTCQVERMPDCRHHQPDKHGCAECQMEYNMHNYILVIKP